MNWANIIKRILGKFWISIFKDSWLHEFIVKVFQFSIGKSLDKKIQIIKDQLSVNCTDLNDYCISQRILVDANNISTTIDISDIIITQDTSKYIIGSNKQGTTYKRINTRNIPRKLKRAVTDTEHLSIDKQYKVYNNTIQFIKPLQQFGFNKKLISINNNIIQCYELWGYDYNRYNTIRDNFSGILNLPVLWYSKYPGSIQAAWDIKMNGATKKNLKNFINTLSYNRQLSSVLDYKDTLKHQTIPFIDVITDIGVFKAINSTFNSININNTDYNILPLQCAQPMLKQEYIKLCYERSKNLKIPYIEIPQVVNPVDFLVKQVWKSSFLFILTYCANREDIKKAAQFINKNIPKTVSLFIYNIQNQNIQSSFYRVFPFQDTEAKLDFYRTTSNKYSLTIQY